MPEVASFPVKATSTAWLYQPLWSGTRFGAPATLTGAVASYMKLNEPLPILPALSVQLADTEAAALSGAEYVAGVVQLAIPEVASVPRLVKLSAWLYQPLWSTGRAGVMLTVGGVASRFTVRSTALVLKPASLVQDPLKTCPVVSVVRN